jgi:hypothetical protein
MKYMYIGDPTKLTPCPNMGRWDKAAPCNDGACRGKIDGVCCFVGGVFGYAIRKEYTNLFAAINEG